jgi:hypothetical protein
MTHDTSGWMVTVGALVTLVLLCFGFGMASEAPTAAENAVGKGLLVLGLCTAIVSVAVLAHAVLSAPKPTPVGRSDWDDV